MRPRSNGTLIDFCEIKDPKLFENLVADLLENKNPPVSRVESTGEGTDYGADLIVYLSDDAPLTGVHREKTAVVQCKHKAKSGKSVGIHEVNPEATLRHYNADIYLLVTSTGVGGFWAGLIQDIQKDKRYRGEDASCWDARRLEQELMQEKNQNVLLNYFPKSAKRILEIKRRGIELLKNSAEMKSDSLKVPPPNELSLSKTSHEDVAMQKIFLIHSKEDLKTLESTVLHERMKQLGIGIETSTDVSNESFWSIERSFLVEEELKKVDAVFAIITKQGAKSPNVWLEIAEARMSGKLKMVFVDESVYSLPLLGKYPCVLLRKNYLKSCLDLERFYRTMFQSWGEKANQWFWFSLSVLATYHRIAKFTNKLRLN